jgi:hypothetical protein
MPDANSGMGSHREEHHERTEQPQQPGATGEGKSGEVSPEQALDEALHRRGKTRKHVAEDR